MKSKKKVLAAILAGCMGEGAEEIYSLGNAGVMTLVNSPMTAEQAQLYLKRQGF